jgi:hypothetical protein
VGLEQPNSFENQPAHKCRCHGWKSPNDNNFGTIAIDKNGTKWLSTNSDGVVGFNESTNTFKKIKQDLIQFTCLQMLNYVARLYQKSLCG